LRRGDWDLRIPNSGLWRLCRAEPGSNIKSAAPTGLELTPPWEVGTADRQLAAGSNGLQVTNVGHSREKLALSLPKGGNPAL